jgi:hypothetical protein
VSAVAEGILSLGELASGLTEAEERVLMLWSARGSSWLSARHLVEEFGFDERFATELLVGMLQRGLVQHISIAFGSAETRWNVSPLGADLIDTLRASYVVPSMAVGR